MADLFGYKVFRNTLEDIDLDKAFIINTINPHSYCIAKNDIEFEKALKESNVLLPDGIGIVWAERFLNKNTIKKIAGYDLFIYLMDDLHINNGRCFFLGASVDTLNKIESKISKEYPNVKVKSYSPPYKALFSEEDSQIMCNVVNDFYT
jgi:N-acetylglucosaminyldiphosphoundecaprenol N-acetyl-beta-D-mannosaminyltransferase